MRIAGQALNLSVAGMFVRAAGSCALGSDVLCDMPLPSGMCQIKGRVTRIQRLPDATGMAIQFIDLPADQQQMLNEVIDRSREPSIPLAVRFEGIASPIQCRGVFFDDKLRLRTRLPFLRVGSNVQVSVDATHQEFPVTADLTGTLASVALRPSPLDGIPRLAIDLDVARPETGGGTEPAMGPTPLERAIADCVSAATASNTPTPSPMPRLLGKATGPAVFERPPPVMVSGELQPRPRTRTGETAAPANDAAPIVETTSPPASSPAARMPGDASAPEPRAPTGEWAETAAIPAAPRSRPSADRPPGRRLPLPLLAAGAFGLFLGALLFRAGRPIAPPLDGRTTARPFERTPAAPAAPAPPAPTIVSLPARATGAPEPSPAASPAAPDGAAVARADMPNAVGRAATPTRRVARRPRPPAPLAFDPATRQYRLNGVAMLDLGGAKLTGLTGLAGAATANLRGIDVAVAAGTTSLHVTFREPEPDAAYGVTVTASWPTITAISEKTAQGFTVSFAAPAPDTATFDWLLVH